MRCAAWSPPDVLLADTAQAFWEAQRENGCVVIHYLMEDAQYGDPLGYQSTWASDRGFDGPVLVETPTSAIAATVTAMHSGGLYNYSVPTTLLISRDLVAVSSTAGAPPEGLQEFTDEVEALLLDPAPF